jgi:hypothetical protein
MGNNERNNYFKIDLYLILIHIFLLTVSYIISYHYPYISNSSKNLILLLFIFIAVCELIPALFITAIVLPHLDKNIKFIRTKKFFLMILYWLSSFFILTFIGISRFFYENVIFYSSIFTFIFLASIYLSMICVAKLTKETYLFILTIISIVIIYVISQNINI